MKAEDKHRWKPISAEHGKAYECLDCGCKKRTARNYISYFRSGIGFGDQRPNCIKEEIESKKTID